MSETHRDYRFSVMGNAYQAMLEYLIAAGASQDDQREFTDAMARCDRSAAGLLDAYLLISPKILSAGLPGASNLNN